MTEQTLRDGTRLLEVAGFTAIPCKGDDEYVPFTEADEVLLCFPGLGHVVLSPGQYAQACDSAVFAEDELRDTWSSRALNNALGDGAQRKCRARKR